MSTSAPAPALFPADADGLVGEPRCWLSDTLPSSKYRFCDGAEVSRDEFSLLFSRIGEDWGDGDGTTTFNLPDLQEVFLVGKGADADFDTLGGSGGSKASNMPAHSHTITPDPHSHTFGHTDVVTATYAAGGQGGYVSETTDATSTTSLTVGNEGSGSATNGNLPPFKVVNWIIKVL